MRKFLLPCVLQFTIALGAIAQFNAIDSTTTDEQALSAIRHQYYAQVGGNRFLSNGREYIPDGRKLNGFPYFLSPDMILGSVTYNSVRYDSVLLSYDLTSDQLVTNNFAHTGLLSLVPEKTDSFELSGHAFFRLVSDSTQPAVSSGFYEILHPTEPLVVVRRTKKTQQFTAEETPKYVEYNQYLIRLNNKFTEVNSERQLMDALADQKDLIKKYGKSHRLSFKKDFERSLISLVGYYSQLKH